MSSLAAWSYTRRATHWPRISRGDWSGVSTWGAPVVFACDYTAQAQRMVDARGVEFTTRQIVFTEKADIHFGDMLLIGEVSIADPVAAGAQEVRAVDRFSDTFEQQADDYRVAT